MKLYTAYTKTVALTALMMLASPVHAFLDIKAVWNSFKQNTGAQIAVGAACTAAVASLGWMLYKRYSKPMQQAKPAPATLNPSLPLIKGPKKDARWNRNTPAPQVLRWSHSKEFVAHNEQNDTKKAKPSLNDLIETHDTPQSFNTVPDVVLVPTAPIDAANDLDRKHVSEEQRRNADEYTAAVAPRKNSAEARDAAKETISKILHKVEQEAVSKRKVEEIKGQYEARLDALASAVSRNETKNAKIELGVEMLLYKQAMKAKKTEYTLAQKNKQLDDIEKRLQDSTLSAQQIDQLMILMGAAKDEVLSFYVHQENADFRKIYAEKFNTVSSIMQPNQAYEMLVKYNILNKKEAEDRAKNIDTKTIRERLQKECTNSAFSKEVHEALRQLEYTFRNDISREQYNDYINGIPPATIDLQAYKNFMKKFEKISIALQKKEAAFNKEEKERDNKNSKVRREPYEEVIKLRGGNVATTSITVDVEEPLITNAVSIVGNQEPVSQESAHEGYTKQFTAAADATATAASQVVNAASKATAAACSAIVSATTATYAAGANLFARTPSPTQVDKPQPTSSSAKATADKSASKMDVSPASPYAYPGLPALQATGDKPVDPLSAAPYPENHVKADAEKAAPVINAGPSIALTVTPSAAAAQAGAAGKSTESLQAEPQKGGALDGSYDMLQSKDDLTGGIVRVAQPMPRSSGASGGASA